MKKFSLTILILFLIIVAFPQISSAQTFDAAKAYQDYQFSLETYNQTNSDFEKARGFYLTNKTLTLKEDTRRKLLIMLKSRDQLESVYLTALRIKIIETKGLADSDKNDIFGKIDIEVAWYKNHQENYKDDDPVENLFNKSSESQSRYKTNTFPVVYESLFDISLGEEVGIRQDHEKIYSDLRSIIDAGVASGKLDMNPFNRWFTDIDSVIETLKKNEELSRTQIKKLYGQNDTNISAYIASTSILSSSIQPLIQANNFLIEMLTSIKNQQ